jgi:hypothetical protein
MKCGMCEGDGIIYLYGGPNQTIKAPCLECSSDRKLEDLETQQWERDKMKLRKEEQAEIEAHNERMGCQKNSVSLGDIYKSQLASDVRDQHDV